VEEADDLLHRLAWRRIPGSPLQGRRLAWHENIRAAEIERFVIDQIKGLRHDSSLVEAITQARSRDRMQIKQWEAERRSLIPVTADDPQPLTTLYLADDLLAIYLVAQGVIFLPRCAAPLPPKPGRRQLLLVCLDRPLKEDGQRFRHLILGAADLFQQIADGFRSRPIKPT